jgi:hypothetical protein
MAAIAFSMQQQQAQNWCWCAVSVSVDVFFNAASTWQQCIMSARGLSQPTCCVNPVPQPCNQPWYLDRALQIVGRLTGAPTAGPLSFAQVQQVINSGNPVCVRIGWYQGGGHFVVISGWQAQPGQQNVIVDDPYFGRSTLDYNQFCTAYRNGQGTWTHTYPV